MAKSAVDFTITSKVDDAIRQMSRVTAGLDQQRQAMMKITSESRRSREASEQTNATMRKIGASATALITTLGVGGGIAGGVSAIVGQVRQWASAMDDVATKASVASKEILALGMLAEKGTKAETVMAAAQLGAKYSMPLGEAVDIYQGIGLSLYKGEEGRRAAETAFKAIKGGMKTEDVRMALSLGKGLGLQPWQAVTYPYVAGEESAYTPQEIIKTAPSLAYWRDPAVAYSAAIQMLKTQSAEKAEVLLKQAGAALTDEMGTTGKLWEKLGVTGAGPFEKVGALKQAGLVSPDQLAAAGISEERQQMGVSGLVRNYEAFVQDAAKIMAKIERDYIWTKRLETEEEIPIIGLTRQVERRTAEYQTELALGPLGERALRYQLAQQERGAEMVETGAPFWLLDLETGTPKGKMGAVYSRLLRSFMGAGAIGAFGAGPMIGRGENVGYGAMRTSDAGLDDRAIDLLERIADNTAPKNKPLREASAFDKGY